MFRFAPVVLLLLVATASSAPLPKAKPAKPDPFEELVQALNHGNVNLPDGVKGVTLREVLDKLERQQEKPIRFVIRDDLFKATGNVELENIKEKAFCYDGDTTDITLNDFLRETLREFKGTYMIRRGRIEVVPLDAVGGLFGESPESIEDWEKWYARIRNTPLANAVFKDKPLAEALGELERVYDRTILVRADAAELAQTPVSARLMNVPLPAAVRELAAGCGLRVKETDGMIVVSAAKRKRK